MPSGVPFHGPGWFARFTTEGAIVRHPDILCFVRGVLAIPERRLGHHSGMVGCVASIQPPAGKPFHPVRVSLDPS
jgi:hypothetical protein